MGSRTAVSLANGAAGRQWSRRWKKRGDGSAYSMLNSISKSEQLLAETQAAAADGETQAAAADDAVEKPATHIQKKAEIRMLSPQEIRALPGAI